MVILSQSRDEVVKLDTTQLYIKIIYHKAILFGINVMHDDVILGTYDDVKQALQEFTNIISYNGLFYLMKEYDYVDEIDE